MGQEQMASLAMKLRLGVIAFGLIATTAAAPSSHRVVVVVAESNDPRAAQQYAALEHDAAALRERDVVVQAITPEAARRDRPELSVNSQASFEILLIGKDGGIKLRREQPVAAHEITALIDTMPMRKSEMRR